jgi:predicted transcriptional regulator
MTQNNVLDFLKKNPNKWFTTNEIIEGLNIQKRSSNISSNLKRLRYYRLVNFEYISIRIGNRYCWKYKHKPEIFDMLR